jgi:DNA polymerase I-like protein with 3'-5' exonuclease and polymerase domains
MQIVTVDFETYYAKGFSLKNLTTEEYIRGAQFQVIGAGVKIDDGETTWHTGDDLKQKLESIDWDNSMLLCHNTMFDGAILNWIFGIVPARYLDTLSMARAVHGVDAGGSLAKLAIRYNIGEKGDEVVKAEGKRLEDFNAEDLAKYGEYCRNDVDLTYTLFNILVAEFPFSELQLIDMTLRMFITPTLEVDDALLLERLEEVREEKSQLLAALMTKLNCDTEECVRKKLSSNKQFAELLQELGITVPMKKSPTTGKDTYALAKNDEGFIALTEHEDPFIQQLCAVRLGTKSTIEESRIERFISVGGRNKGKLPIPLKYYGAHTGRWAGSDKVNFQNLPSRDKKKKALKNAVIPPEGQVVINCDSSQIEARVLAWWAGQDDIVEVFARGDDVYSVFASKVYNRPISKKDPVERFVGKTCVLGLGYGTGWAKLQHTLKTTPPGADLTEEECRNLVNIYREVNDKIIELWRECDDVLGDLADWPRGKQPYFLGNHKCVLVTPKGIRLPNGLYITYPQLRWDTSEAKSRYVYKSRKGDVSIWGGSVVENVVQALARIIVGEQMIKITDDYPVVLTVHDAAVVVTKKELADETLNHIMSIMSEPPEWATGLPVACEGHYGNSYGEC